MSASRHGRLAASRQAQAFNALLEKEISDDEDGLDARQTSRKATAARERRDRRRSGNVAVPGFSLREDALAAERAADVEGDAVPVLRQMFPAAEPALLAEVSAACGGSVNAAIDALLAMNVDQQGAPAQPSSQPTPSRAEGVSNADPPQFAVFFRLGATMGLQAAPAAAWDITAIPGTSGSLGTRRSCI